MEQHVIKSLTQDFGPVKWVNKSVFGFKNEGWFVIDTIPLPPRGEIEEVISDILNDHEISYANGTVRHWPDCQHSHALTNSFVKEVIKSLKEEPFRIAVCVNNDEKYLEGQPIVISLNPAITYMNYPDHPHLNSGGPYGGIYIPDSFCYGYTTEPLRYGPSEYEKFIRVFDEATLWLFRHQVWAAIRKNVGKGQWIGKHYKDGLPPIVYANLLNPLASCRCGKQKRYLECHLPIDIAETVRKRVKETHQAPKEVQDNIIKALYNTWTSRIYNPQTEMLKKLNHMIH